MAEISFIDPGIYRLVEVFRGSLDDVSFPDVDRQVLEALAAEVGAQHERVEALRAELASAEQQLASARTALVDRAREGLAYARLYATRHPELARELDAIELDRPKRGRKPKKPRAVKAAAEGADHAEATGAAPRRTRAAAPEEAALQAS